MGNFSVSGAAALLSMEWNGRKRLAGKRTAQFVNELDRLWASQVKRCAANRQRRAVFDIAGTYGNERRR